MLKINAIVNTCNIPLNEYNYIPKSKQWTRCNQMKKWLINKLILIEKHSQSWGKPRRYFCKYNTNNRRPTCTNIVKTTTIIMTAVMAMQAKHGYASAHTINFDTDSQPIGVDNRCTACISHIADDFEGPLHDSNRKIKGFGGTHTTNLKTGTLKWKWADDEGKVHTFYIPNSYYAPDGGVRLLSPQHWAKTQKDYKPTPGTGETTLHNSCKLFWNQGKNTLHIPMSKGTNVDTFYQAPGYDKFTIYCTECEADDMELNPIASPAHIIHDKEHGEIPDDRKEHTEYDQWLPSRASKAHLDDIKVNPFSPITSSKDKHRDCRRAVPTSVLSSDGGKRGPRKKGSKSSTKSGKYNTQHQSDHGIPGIGIHIKQDRVKVNLDLTPIPT